MLSQEKLQSLFDRWIDTLRLKNQWDIRLELVSDPAFKKTGDFKIIARDQGDPVTQRMQSKARESGGSHRS